MSTDTNSSTYVKALGYVKRTKNRQQIVNIIANTRKTPSEIKEIMDVDFSLVSRALRDLKDRDIVVCENPEDRIGRLHKLTNLGLQIYEELNQK